MMKRTAYIALAAVIMLSAAAIPAYAAGFTDVPAQHPYKTEIDYCKEMGFIEGYNSTTFGPEDSLTRATFSVLWARTKQINRLPNFSDIIKPRNWYEGQMFVLYSLGIINGVSSDEIGATSPLNREQLAALTSRTYELMPDDENDYTAYADHASISTWARNDVSACLNAGVFEGLYSVDNDFQPKKNVTRAEVCKLIYNIMHPGTPPAEEYSITIGTLTDGSISSDLQNAAEGATVTLTITPGIMMQLKAGTLMFNDTPITGNTFTMPAENVTITAEFEPSSALTDLILVDEPTKTEYTTGETLDLSGISVKAKFADESEHDVTAHVTTDPANGALLTDEGVQTVTVAYTHGTVDQSVTFTVTVTDEEPEVTEEPTEEPT